MLLLYIILFLSILLVLLYCHKRYYRMSELFLNDIQEIDKHRLQTFFPDAQFNLWVCHYVFIHYHGRKYLYKDYDNTGFSINNLYVPFWFKYIDPYILSKRNYEKYYFIFSVWDGSYVETPMNGTVIEFMHSTSINEFQEKKRLRPSLLPILHNKKYFGCFSKHIHDPIAIAILDPLFIETHAYEKEKRLIDSHYLPWHEKKNKIVFRGSIKNGSPYNFIHYENMIEGHRRFLYKNRDKFKKILDYEDNYLSITEMCKFKYILDIDGWTNAWGLVWKLYSGSVVMKNDSVWKQWYYDSLKPFVHYVPILNDLSDLQEKYQWCIDHPDECEIIIKNAIRFVKDRLNMDSATKDMQDIVWSQYFSNIHYL